MATKRHLVVLDMHAILHRAYHALPDFSSSKGEPTGALYGLVSILVRVIADLKPDYLVAAFDVPKPTYRHVVYEGYKAQRPKTDDALISQIKRSRDVLEALNIPHYEHEGFEADDVIGTVVEKLKKQKDLKITIASSDLDTLQLVEGTRVRVFTHKKGLSETLLYDKAAVVNRYGFEPKYVPDYKGLNGDQSDNIPGVVGIGEKTAQTLVSKFGTLEHLYQELKKNPKKVISAGIKEGIVKKLLEQKEAAFFSKSLAEIRRNVPINFSLPEKTWKKSVSSTQALDMLSEFDFRSLMPRLRELLGTPSEEEDTLQTEEDVPSEKFAKAALAVWVLDSSITTPIIDDIYRLGKSRDFATAEKVIEKELEVEDLIRVYKDIELPLMPILREMEKRGIKIDRAFLKGLSKRYHTELEKLAQRIYSKAGATFNINSPKQLGEILFDKLGLAVKNQKKTSTGARSTRESELEKMKDLHPIIDDVLAYRELQKLLSTYIDSIPTLLDINDRLHTSFIQTGTTTGRLASQDPNLQNIPIKSDLGRAIRHAFVADEGMVLLSFDYSQIELRIAALLSRDRELIEIFKKGRDVHTEVASKIFNVPATEVTYEQRRRAKVINFGILYGMGVVSLRETLGTTRGEAQQFYDEYFETFPELASYIDEVKAKAARDGYTATYFGRRRYFEGIHSPIPYVRAAAERMAVNAPIQGTQSDIIKLAMVRIDAFVKEHNLQENIHLLLQVHDELLFEVVRDKVKPYGVEIKAIMEDVLPSGKRHGIPLIVEGKVGDNWGEMKPL